MQSFLILAPLFCVIALNILFRDLMKRAAFFVALTLIMAQMFLVFVPTTAFLGFRLDALGVFLKFNLSADLLSLVMLFCIGIVMFTALLIGRGTIDDVEKRFNFTNLLLIMLSGLNGIVMVTDIFSLYVFLEISAVASFILISLDQKEDAFEGAFKYIILSATASVLIVSSIALLLLVSGSTSFAVIGAAIKTPAHNMLITFSLAVLICGFFIKGGLMPFHGWLPDVYSSAPAPVSVLLAGIVTKTVGIYPLIRILTDVVGIDKAVGNVLLFIGAVSIVLGALAAMGQNDIKRMLAYSSISQVGYIILGLGCGTWLGFVGAVFHLFNHSIFKSLLFVNSTAVEIKAGTRDMNRVSGLSARMPLTGATSILASLSASGVPPLSGFWSKLIIILALWASGSYAYAVIAVLASVLTLAYMLSMQRRVFFGKIGIEFANIDETNFGLTVSSIVLAAITILIGVIFPFIMGGIMEPARSMLIK